MAGGAAPDPAFRDVVARLLSRPAEALRFRAVTGGVSSEIWQVCDGAQHYCAKRALPRLKVRARWEAPVSRNAEEVRWLRTARRWVGETAAAVVAADADAGIAVLEWYDPGRWHNWKQLLLGDPGARLQAPDVARHLGELLGRIALRSSTAPELAAEFANQSLFDALRIDPFFRCLLPRHPPLAALVDQLEAPGRTLIHGDFSPKNLLVDATGSIRILDAECATWGCPGFDPGYLMAHLLLKHSATGDPLLLAAARAFWAAYLTGIGERFADIEINAGRVLLGMLLARIDGKSPVDYLSAALQDSLRRRALELLSAPPGQQGASLLLAGWSLPSP
ncbi:MAG: phosphotransferase [Pseudomonadales bacterium]